MIRSSVAAAVSAAILLSVSSALSASQVNQVDRWNRAEIRKIDILRLDKAVALFQRTRTRYENIPAPKEVGAASRCPAPVLFCLHYRESDNNFRCHAHEGSPLTHRTRDEPKGRLPHVKGQSGSDPPYTFEQSAEDAYYVCDKLQLTNWASIQSALDRTERFNGYGYRQRDVASPYNWSGTNLYSRGKYVADGRFDPLAIDKQLGVAAILKRMIDRGIDIPSARQ